jgi:hypothetical protein
LKFCLLVIWNQYVYSAFLLNLRYRIYLWLQSCAENLESMVMWQYSFLPTWSGDKILLWHLIIFIWKSTVFPGIWLALSSAIRAWNQNPFSTNYTRVLTSANRSDLHSVNQLPLLFVDIHTQCKHCLHAHHCIISILACDGKTNIHSHCCFRKHFIKRLKDLKAEGLFLMISNLIARLPLDISYNSFGIFRCLKKQLFKPWSNSKTK